MKKRVKDENAAIREWARTSGIHIGDRGRIPDEIRAKYRNLKDKPTEVVSSRKHKSCEFCSDVRKLPRHDLCPVFTIYFGKTWYCECAKNSPETHNKEGLTAAAQGVYVVRVGPTTKKEEAVMAQVERVELTSDLSGKPTSEKFQRRVLNDRGEVVVVDLTEQEAEKLDTFLAKYLAAGRVVAKVTQGVKTRQPVKSESPRADAKAVRAWANSPAGRQILRRHNLVVGARGRIHPDVITEYELAH